VSDPQTLIAGNEYNLFNFQHWMIEAWLANRWIELI
jgi:hypothetical protein